MLANLVVNQSTTGRPPLPLKLSSRRTQIPPALRQCQPIQNVENRNHLTRKELSRFMASSSGDYLKTTCFLA
jgi:hypothetical protein